MNFNKIILTQKEHQFMSDKLNEYNYKKGFQLVQTHTGIGPSLTLKIYDNDNKIIEIDITDYDSW